MSRESLIVVESVLQSPNVTRIPFHRSPIVVEFARESRSSSNPPSRANSVGNHRANPPVSHESQSSTRSRLRNRWGTTVRIPDVTRIPDRRRIHRRVRNPNGNPPCAPPMSRESLIVVEFAVAQWESMGILQESIVRISQVTQISKLATNPYLPVSLFHMVSFA